MTFDIYTNRAPFRLLTKDERRQLMDHDGEIAQYNGYDFHVAADVHWSSNVIYRAVRPVPTKPSINWDHVADEFIAMATEEDKDTWLYEKIPTDKDFGWVSCRDHTTSPADSFASFVPGTCDWRDSLVIRPGYKGE